jgi:hypothetical protein
MFGPYWWRAHPSVFRFLVTLFPYWKKRKKRKRRGLIVLFVNLLSACKVISLCQYQFCTCKFCNYKHSTNFCLLIIISVDKILERYRQCCYSLDRDNKVDDEQGAQVSSSSSFFFQVMSYQWLVRLQKERLGGRWPELSFCVYIDPLNKPMLCSLLNYSIGSLSQPYPQQEKIKFQWL